MSKEKNLVESAHKVPWKISEYASASGGFYERSFVEVVEDIRHGFKIVFTERSTYSTFAAQWVAEGWLEVLEVVFNSIEGREDLQVNVVFRVTNLGDCYVKFLEL